MATATKAPGAHGYEFGGPLGAFATSLGLPLVCYLFTFICNDISGCPAPVLLHPTSLTVDKLKAATGWPGFSKLLNSSAVTWLIAYYTLSLILQAFLPGHEAQGVELASGGRLKYKFNAFRSAILVLLGSAVGTYFQGADFVLWTFIWDNYTQLLTANLVISFALACFVYIRSFEVRPGNGELRELAAGGHSGNIVYDWFIGRELNPRIQVPLIGEIDIKAFCELRPGMLGWLLLDAAFMAHQYKLYGHLSDSIILLTAFQSLYVLDALYMEPAILTTMDITTDGFGFMLAFGDLVWLPFTYSLQARYLAIYPHHLGYSGIATVLAVQALGYFIFRSANNEKNRFRTNPNDPKVAHLRALETKSGSKLLISGWWGASRHINYFGDWIMAWSYVLPTGFAGYIITSSSLAASAAEGLTGTSSAATAAGLPPGAFLMAQHVGASTVQTVVPGPAQGWGMFITYFYLLYFAILLIHRERRDEEKCRRKYGADWEEYKRLVPARIVPYLY